MSKLTIKIVFYSIFYIFFTHVFSQQTIIGVYSDYGGYWHSELGNISTVRPDNSHNLLGFTTNGGNTFSTGVNDATLSSNSITYSPQIFESMPVVITGNVGFFWCRDKLWWIL